MHQIHVRRYLREGPHLAAQQLAPVRPPQPPHPPCRCIAATHQGRHARCPPSRAVCFCDITHTHTTHRQPLPRLQNQPQPQVSASHRINTPTSCCCEGDASQMQHAGVHTSLSLKTRGVAYISPPLPVSFWMATNCLFRDAAAWIQTSTMPSRMQPR